MVMQLTPDQVAEIRRRVEGGEQPDDIANFLGRVADLDAGDIAQIRSVALELQEEHRRHSTS